MTQEKQEKKQEQEPIFIITLGLAQRIMRYIQSSPSPNIPVGEAMDIVQQLSRLPQAQVSAEQPKPPTVPQTKVAAKTTKRSKSTK